MVREHHTTRWRQLNHTATDRSLSLSLLICSRLRQPLQLDSVAQAQQRRLRLGVLRVGALEHGWRLRAAGLGHSPSQRVQALQLVSASHTTYTSTAVVCDNTVSIASAIDSSIR